MDKVENNHINIDQAKPIMSAEKWLKVAIYVGGFLVLSTNTVNYWIFSVAENRTEIKANNEAQQRRLFHATEKQDLKREIDLKTNEVQLLKIEIEGYKHLLKNCDGN